ncbi:MAG TPA: TM2 domain-containing protein [Kofleriaceae bacterium]|nr:TM2 domain-containing protein [Kofleriaceae bacterium]
MEDLYRDNPHVPATLGPGKKHCYACASILDMRAELCPQCGVRQPLAPGSLPQHAMQTAGQHPVAHTTKNKVTAGVLALLLGWIGVHRFYLGHIGLGVLYLLFCWTFIPALIAFIEGIVFLTMSDQAFAARYPG